MDNTTTNVQGREIKFRYVWKHDGTGEIRTKEYSLDDIQHGKVEGPDFTIRWDLIAELQFTGLRDKSGKEIYEGDILSYDYADHGKPYLEEKRKEPCYVVKYDPENDFHLGGFDVDKKRNLFAHAFRFKQTEILGNIYEHPHLLKTEQHAQRTGMDIGKGEIAR